VPRCSTSCKTVTSILISYFNTSYYRKWWSDYPQNYDQRIVEQNYLNYEFSTVGALKYYALPEKVGYMRYSTFSTAIGESTLDAALLSLKECSGLIIDIRDNGGGDMDNVETLVMPFPRRADMCRVYLPQDRPRSQ